MAGLIGREDRDDPGLRRRGAAVPVTVVEAGPCPVVQVKTESRRLPCRPARLRPEEGEARDPKAELGHAAKAWGWSTPPGSSGSSGRGGRRVRAGQELTVEQFEPGDRVKVVGTSKGRGFQGVVKRHGFAGRPGGHGHPMSRNPGSLGPGNRSLPRDQGQEASRTDGQHPDTVRNLEIVKVDPERNLLFVKGGVPGARNSYLFISK
jgi:large subunit ribosomal protein L3